MQTRDHLFKVCSEWKTQLKILWAEVLKEAGKGKSRFKLRDLLDDGKCSQAILDILFTTDAGRLVPAEEARKARCQSGSAGSAGSGKRSGGWRPRSWVPGGGTTVVSPHTLVHGICGRGVGAVTVSCVLSFVLSFVISLVRFYLLGTGLGGGQMGACNVPPSRRLRTGIPDSVYLAVIYLVACE